MGEPPNKRANKMENLKIKDEFELPVNGQRVKVQFDGVTLYPQFLKFSFFSNAFGRSGKKTVKLLVKKFNESAFQDYIECAYVLAKSWGEEIFYPSPALPVLQQSKKAEVKQPSLI